jgi:hypothetical protein
VEACSVTRSLTTLPPSRGVVGRFWVCVKVCRHGQYFSAVFRVHLRMSECLPLWPGLWVIIARDCRYGQYLPLYLAVPAVVVSPFFWVFRMLYQLGVAMSVVAGTPFSSTSRNLEALETAPCPDSERSIATGISEHGASRS